MRVPEQEREVLRDLLPMDALDHEACVASADLNHGQLVFLAFAAVRLPFRVEPDQEGRGDQHGFAELVTFCGIARVYEAHRWIL